MPFAFWLPRVKKIIEMGGPVSANARRERQSRIRGGRCCRATAHFN